MTKDKKQYKILLVEDNPGDVTIIEDLLLEQIRSPVIIKAASFKEASAILGREKSFSIILLDLSLPDKNGQQLIDEMLRIIPTGCPIIILTGYTDIGFSIKSIGKGIMDYLLKDDLTSLALYKSMIYSIERLNSIAELKASAKRYTDMFNLSPQPMWVCDMETLRFLQVNKAASVLYGYSESEFLQMSVLDILPDENKDIAQQSLARSLTFAENKYMEEKHRRKDAELIDVEIYATPIVIDGKQFRSVIVIDVTERNIHEHKITKAIIKTQEDERYEIGAELHDNVCQILATSQLSLGMLKESLTPSSMKWFDHCRQYIVLATEEIRNLSHRLAPAFFNDSSLGEAFSVLLGTFNISQDYEVSMEVDPRINKAFISLELQLNLYRIVQEQLKNILKYAKAGKIDISVVIQKDTLLMKVSDDGIGCDISTIRTGIGMANMKRRAELFAGKFELKTSPGKGCTVKITIPLDQAITEPRHIKLQPTEKVR